MSRPLVGGRAPKRQPFEVLWIDGVKVPIHRSVSKGVPMYTVIYYLDGKVGRIKKSFADLEEARAFAQGVPALMGKRLTMRKELRGEEVVVYERADVVSKSTGMPLDHLAVEYAQMAKDLGPDTSLREVVRDYLRRRPEKCLEITLKALQERLIAKSTRRKNTKRTLRSGTRRLVEFMQKRRGVNVKVHEILLSDIRAWVGDYDPSQAHRLRYVRRLFRFARAEGFLPEDQRTVADRHPRLEKPTMTDDQIDADMPEIYRPLEIERMIAWLWPKRHVEWARHRLLYLVLGCFAGIRPTEITRMSWKRNINLEAGTILIQPSIAKDKRRREFSIEPNLLEWLKVLKPVHGGKFVPFQISSKMSAMSNKLGIKWIQDGMRHSYGSYLFAIERSMGMVTKAMGNSAAIFYSHYLGIVAPGDGPRYWDIYPDQWEVADSLYQSRSGLLLFEEASSERTKTSGRAERIRLLLLPLREVFTRKAAYKVLAKGQPSLRVIDLCNQLNSMRQCGFIAFAGSPDRFGKTAKYLLWDKRRQLRSRAPGTVTPAAVSPPV